VPSAKPAWADALRLSLQAARAQRDEHDRRPDAAKRRAASLLHIPY
jgi:hypothetical protein